MELDEIFLKVCKAFNRNQVNYVVVGGFAVIIHGFPRATIDIDLVVEVTNQNIERLKKALFSVFRDKAIEEITLEDLNKYAVVRYGTPDGFYIDIIGRIGRVANYNTLKEDITIFRVLEVDIPVCGLNNLIKLKETSRPKDKVDLLFLKEKLRKE